jgi:hypothetical protein
MKLFIQHAQDLKKPWAQMSKHQQDDTLDSIRASVQDAVKQAVELIAARDRVHVIGTLEQITIKNGVRASVMVGKGCPGLSRLFECQGEAVAVVVAHPGEELKGIFDIKGQDDQRGLDLGHEYKRNSDGEGMEGAAESTEGTKGAHGLPDSDLEDEAMPEELTELYDQAVAAVIAEQRPSVHFLQKELGIGSEKAKTLLDFMQMNGVVTAPDERGFRQLVSTVPA